MKKFRDLKISNKLITAFVVVALIAVVIGGVGLFNIQKLQTNDNLLFNQNFNGIAYTGDTYGNFQGLRYALEKFKSTSEEEKAAVQKETDYYTNKVDGLMAGYVELAKNSNVDIKAQVDENFANWNAWKDSTLKAYTARSTGNEAEAMEYFAKADEITATLEDGIINLMELNYMDAQARSNTNKSVAQLAMISVIVICVAGGIISVVLGLVISRIISKPINKMVEAADQIALGDVDVTIDIDSKDETGKLAASLTNMIENIRKQAKTINQVEQGDLTIDVDIRSENDVLGKSLSGLVNNMSDMVSGIVSAADQVASGAQLVSNSSMTLSQGATEQASQIEEFTASLEEISSQTALNAQNAEKASMMATNAKKEAEQGNTQMNSLLKAMDAISASSGDINKIIKIIDDIAFQTNILALNAAVEAARAGQYGKGFAVVAEEVRVLASKSASAAKDTTEMIDSSIRNVKSGIKIANETAEALNRIVAEVSNATELVGSIAIASKEQTLGIGQLNQGILQLSQVVQSNAATSEESAAASEELSSQADQLREVVSVFKVKSSIVNHSPKISATSVRAPSQARALPSYESATKIEPVGNLGKY